MPFAEACEEKKCALWSGGGISRISRSNTGGEKKKKTKSFLKVQRTKMMEEKESVGIQIKQKMSTKEE